MSHEGTTDETKSQQVTTRVSEPVSNDSRARHQQEEQERAVGITSFASKDVYNLQCIFKQRYTDFQVNEILLSGEVLHLTELAEAPDKKQKQEKTVKPANTTEISEANRTLKRSAEDEDETISKKQKTDVATSGREIDVAVPVKVEISDTDMQMLKELFGENTTTEIVKLYTAVLTHPTRKPRVHATVKTEVIESKSTRTQAHGAIRNIFQSKLETATSQEEPGRMTVRAAPPKSDKQTNGREHNKSKDGVKKGRFLWQELGGEYLHFTLYKENKDTMEVLYFIASQLKMGINSFGFAGTKDRRGVTVQRVSAYRVQKERLLHLTRLARGWRIGNFEYKPSGLELAQLGGNEFVITLRDCRMTGHDNSSAQDKLKKIEQTVSQAASDLGKNGYINYYGLQRFGSYQTGTHIVGMKILQNDLEGAIDSILAYDPAVLPQNHDDTTAATIPKDDIDRAEAIRIWQETHDASRVRDRMPKRFQAESNIIQWLGRKSNGHKQDKDWQGALMCIQRNLRLMYVHAYQSLVWNNAAVKRRELYGDKVVEGDLVVIGDKADDFQKPEDKTDQDGEEVVHPSASEEEGPGEDAFIRARPLSKEEADSGRWDIFDVVLPQPGWDVVYPSNEVGKFYKDFMGSEEGGRLDPNDMRRKWKDASLSGSYRKLMSRPLNGKVEVTTHLYRGEEQVAETDLDRLRKQEVQDETAQGEEKVAVVLKLQLGKSQYATMALRELSKGGAVAYRPEFSADRGRAIQ
ncbi:hypothetical protein AMS68_001475 [Peltaster fructicola]|uniref:TRUD domain-containing protein n=1 Tax=Peltaster fructicola TaxID=286661 RepID=A0A6H0XMW5_9PEZI|nr:hypothetical protein AMS68_001475 [Peltaster fructicola]